MPALYPFFSFLPAKILYSTATAMAAQMTHASQTLAKPTLTISPVIWASPPVGDKAEAHQDAGEQHHHRHIDEIEAGEDKIAGNDQQHQVDAITAA